MIPVPEEIGAILAKLRAAGFEAQAVGGCVRDSLLGLTPGDWDICTSALPEEVASCFGEGNIIPTGQASKPAARSFFRIASISAGTGIISRPSGRRWPPLPGSAP